MVKTVTIFSAAVLLNVLAGCAGHNELKSPCARSEAGAVSLFSSVAYAADVSCGPMVRQDGVSVF